MAVEKVPTWTITASVRGAIPLLLGPSVKVALRTVPFLTFPDEDQETTALHGLWPSGPMRAFQHLLNHR